MMEKSPAAEIDTTNGSQRVPMEVLVFGLSRTGTSSMQQALMQLGYPQVYHTRTVYFRPDDGYVWSELLDRKFSEKKPISKMEWDRLLGNFSAVTDVPCVIFWRELMEAYPDAKIILTVRDSTEAWYKSYVDTIGYLTSHHQSLFSWIVRSYPVCWLLGTQATPFDRMIDQQIKYTPRGRYQTEGKKWYEEHNKAVKEAVPADNLLVFNVKQGWEPLCRFLGKTVPSTPFPRVFSTDEYHKLIAPRVSGEKSRVSGKLIGLGIVGVAISVGIRSTLNRG